MANWYLDTGAGGDTSGDTMINAFQDFKVALEFTGYDPGDILWVRRRSLFDGASSNIAPTDDGTLKDPIRVIGWPRFGDTGVGSFFQGNNVVTNVNDITPYFYHHAGRYIKNVTNDRNYLITAIATRIGYDGGDSRIFSDGDMIKNGDSDAYAKIHYVDGDSSSGDLWVVMQTGAFADGDSIHYHGTGDSVIWLVNGTPGDSGFIIDRKYAGDSEVDGAFEVLEDEDYTLSRTVYAGDSEFGDSWDSDGDSLPIIDFEDTNYKLDLTGPTYLTWNNLNFRGSSNSLGTVTVGPVRALSFIGCIFEQTSTQESIYFNDAGGAFTYIKQCIFRGTNVDVGTAQIGINGIDFFKLIDSAIYNYGGGGVNSQFSSVYLENVNIGIELPNGSSDITTSRSLQGRNIDCNTVSINSNASPLGVVCIENYQKLLGQHKTWYCNGEITKTDVSVSGDPQKRVGGANSLIAITADGNANREAITDWANMVFEHEFLANTTSKSYRYYVQPKDVSYTTNQLWLEAEYIDEYGDSTYYHSVKTVSDETGDTRGDTTDWSGYIEVTGVQPAILSTVKIKCYISHYDADGIIYIDPQPVIY